MSFPPPSLYIDESLLTAVPQRILDSRLYFMNDSPRVYGNSVSADFVVGRSFTSVKCQLNTRNRKPRDCKPPKYCAHT